MARSAPTAERRLASKNDARVPALLFELFHLMLPAGAAESPHPHPQVLGPYDMVHHYMMIYCIHIVIYLRHVHNLCCIHCVDKF